MQPSRIKAGTALVLLALTVGCTTVPSPAPTTAQSSAPVASPSPAPLVVISLLPPEKPGKVQLLVNDPSTVLAQPDNEPYGPSAFFVQGDTITMEDRLRHTLNVYRDGKLVERFASPDTCCRDLLIDTNNHYWILSEDTAWEYIRQPGAKKLSLLNSYPAGDDQPTWLFQEGPNIEVKQFGDEVVLAVGPGPIGPAPKVKLLKHSIQVIDGQQLNVEIRSHYPPLGLRMLTRTAEYYYLWWGDAFGPNYGFIYQLTKTGQLVNTFTLVPPGDKYPWRSVQVAADGQVYEMVVTDHTTKIYRIPANS
jgi:hypothetical protein